MKVSGLVNLNLRSDVYFSYNVHNAEEAMHVELKPIHARPYVFSRDVYQSVLRMSRKNLLLELVRIRYPKQEFLGDPRRKRR